MSIKTISKGFLIAGMMNMSVLFFSKFFTNLIIPKFDPMVMSNFGLMMIMIWGLAYISVAYNVQHVKWLIAVFAIEKLIYGVIWINWHFQNNVSDVFKEDFLAGVFYSIYGLNDLIFCSFFSWVVLRLNKKGKNP